MGHKRAQITIFMILGLLILIGVISWYAFLGSKKVQVYEDYSSQGMAADIAPINSFITSCVERTAREGLVYISAHGGYYDVGDPYFDADIDIPFYFYEGRSYLPDLGTIEAELSSYVADNLPSCLLDLKDFEDQGFKVSSEGTPKVNSTISSSISVYADIPVVISKGGSEYRPDTFSAKIKTEFIEDYNAVMRFAGEQENDYTSMPVISLALDAYENNYTCDIYQYGNDTIIYSYNFPENESSMPVLVFNIAGRYENDLS